MTALNAKDPATANPVSVAPMMAWTDRHCRYFMRQLSRQCLLYTEMVTTGAVLHGKRSRLLAYHPDEHPLAIQLGGSDPQALAECARIAESLGFDEVNLNVGCPSDRVRTGRFGACLMAEPALVARCVEAMRRAVDIPVTVKSRIGIDDQEEWPTLRAFVDTVSAAGCTRFIVHARKAILSGLSPKENREIPPLRYDLVYRLKSVRPDLAVIINGGITSLEEVDDHLRHVDGVMLGRAAYRNPYILSEVDRRYFGDDRPQVSRHDTVLAIESYVAAELAAGTPLAAIVRHMLGLFQNVPGARAWRRHLSERMHRSDAGLSDLRDALEHVSVGLPGAAD